MYNKKVPCLKGNNFLKYSSMPSGGGSVTIGGSKCGSMSFVASNSGIPSESGMSETIAPGVKKNYLGPGKSEGGVVRELPKWIAGLIPSAPSHVPDPTGLVAIVPVLVGAVLLLRSNRK